MLSLEGIAHRYGCGTEVLRDVTLRLEPGLTALIGPNGSGKSTLLRIAAGLLAPWRGEVRLDGRPLVRVTTWERARRVAYVPQQVLLPEGMEVLQVVLLGRLPHMGWLGPESVQDRAAAWRAMEATGVSGLAHRPVETLSGGERQRVALARALATGARHLLLDEPTSHLDLHHQSALVGTLRALVERSRLAVLMVVHDPNLAALADRVVMLADGRVVADGPPRRALEPAALRAAYGDGFVILEGPDGRRAVVPSAASPRLPDRRNPAAGTGSLS
ncbi:ABC transporter ATP-binding protein [Geochorda subterranea]|uniref:ABC transporter ATP-binding protein n=1 Tax=Geochorda subterranea TaxID=3109564 RepID=A0ABZ1BNU2_9FIRM|nr:ABC transporter ATP-binding protein [Limnochorda sp. LNt]WRP14389.1 ABC transporter ATP-binding protein [Limnochorda sp. LNt]